MCTHDTPYGTAKQATESVRVRGVAKRDQAGSERVQRFVHDDFGFIVIRHRRPQNIGKLNQLAVHLSIAQPLGSQARTSGYIG